MAGAEGARHISATGVTFVYFGASYIHILTIATLEGKGDP